MKVQRAVLETHLSSIHGELNDLNDLVASLRKENKTRRGLTLPQCCGNNQLSFRVAELVNLERIKKEGEEELTRLKGEQ